MLQQKIGYYVHLSTYAEVREEVLKYIPVMARPMVLNPSRKPNPTWSPVYADVTDPKLTNWLWINRQRNKQRDIFLMYRRNRTLYNPDEQDRKYVHQQKLVSGLIVYGLSIKPVYSKNPLFQKQDNYGELQYYRLMTSVSLPVYDRRENAVSIRDSASINFTLSDKNTRKCDFVQKIIENIMIKEDVWQTVVREVNHD